MSFYEKKKLSVLSNASVQLRVLQWDFQKRKDLGFNLTVMFNNVSDLVHRLHSVAGLIMAHTLSMSLLTKILCFAACVYSEKRMLLTL